MELFTKTRAVKLRSHLDKYLMADDDEQTVRQSRNGSSVRAIWVVEPVEGKPQAIRLRSCHGLYLTASNAAFLLGMTGNKVLQTVPANLSDWMIQWEPIRDGFQVKLKSWCGTFLRANGGPPPWRNSITHDEPHTSPTQNWILWEAQAVEAPESESIMSRGRFSMSSLSSALSDDLLGSEPGSPAKAAVTKSPRFSSKRLSNRVSGKFRSAMELFHKAKAVRLRSHHDKYLVAEEDEESVTQVRNGSAKNAKWAVEFVPGYDSVVRFKSCYGKYLTASNQPFLLGMTGRKVLQTVPARLDSSVEWEPIREGVQVKLKTQYGHYLRANGGVPPWRNSVTHDIPHRTATQDWVLWDVDIVEIEFQPHCQIPIPAQPVDRLDSLDFDSSSTSSASIKSDHISRTESIDYNNLSSPPKSEGRTIYYHVADEHGNVEEDVVEGHSFTFKGSGIEELTHKLEEETSLDGIVVCTRSPLNGSLCPIRLQLPPNNATMHVVVVLKSSRVGKEFAKQGIL